MVVSKKLREDVAQAVGEEEVLTFEEFKTLFGRLGNGIGSFDAFRRRINGVTKKKEGLEFKFDTIDNESYLITCSNLNLIQIYFDRY